MFDQAKAVLPQAGAVVKPDRATSAALGRQAPGERRHPGASVLAADKAILSEPYSAPILLLLEVTAPRHGTLRIYGRLRADSVVAHVVLPAARIGRELSVACASRSTGPDFLHHPRCPMHRLLAVWLSRNTSRRRRMPQ